MISRRQFLKSLCATVLVPKAAVGVLAKKSRVQVNHIAQVFDDGVITHYVDGERIRQPDFFDVVVALGVDPTRRTRDGVWRTHPDNMPRFVFSDNGNLLRLDKHIADPTTTKFIECQVPMSYDKFRIAYSHVSRTFGLHNT